MAELVERMKLTRLDIPNDVHEFKLRDTAKPAIDFKKLAEQLQGFQQAQKQRSYRFTETNHEGTHQLLK
jgi:hypothetical protein